MGIVFYARLRKRSMRQDGYILTNYEIEVPEKIIRANGIKIGEILRVEIEPLGIVLPGKGVSKAIGVVDNGG